MVSLIILLKVDELMRTAFEYKVNIFFKTKWKKVCIEGGTNQFLYGMPHSPLRDVVDAVLMRILPCNTRIRGGQQIEKSKLFFRRQV